MDDDIDKMSLEEQEAFFYKRLDEIAPEDREAILEVSQFKRSR